MKLQIIDKILKNFNQSDWYKLGVLTDSYELIKNHDRLLRSLSFGDDDYEANIISIIQELEKRSPNNLKIIDDFIEERYPDSQDGELVSSPRVGNRKKIVFAPIAFNIPEESTDEKSVAVIFPFELEKTYNCVKNVCDSLGLHSVKANDLPTSDAFMQNIFKMIYTCRVAVCDFTGGKGNVLYETGIAHTLGKEMIAITQSMDDVPTDLKHINMIVYENSEGGYQKLMSDLKKRLETIFPDNLNLPF